MKRQDKMIRILERFSNAFGPAGFEEELIPLIAEYLPDYKLERDSMNNVYVYEQGEEDKPCLLIDAHMDECGFMVQSINDNGSIAFMALGGIAPSTLSGHKVLIRTRQGEKVKGVITAKPVHFMNDAERNQGKPSMETMIIDVGATNRKDVEAIFGISLGDPIIFDGDFSYEEKTGVCAGKSFDNRVGCTCLVETLDRLKEEDSLPVKVAGLFSSQEELGLRGATVATRRINPDIAIVFEGAPCDDFFVSSAVAQGSMKKGVQLRLGDSSYITNPVFAQIARETAQKEEIPFQEAVRRGGGTNAGKISLTMGGIPTLVLSVPCRYIHSPNNYCAIEDMESAIRLAIMLVKKLDKNTINSIKKVGAIRQDQI